MTSPKLLPGRIPAWPLKEGWWLVAAERAWRLDAHAPKGEKHYFMIMRPASPHWSVGLFTPELADSVQMWLDKNGYPTPRDFKQFLARAQLQDVPVGMLQFSAVPGKGAKDMKVYHSTDMRGQDISNFADAHDAISPLYPSLDKYLPWTSPIEGISSRAGKWELYTQAAVDAFPKFPEDTIQSKILETGAQCRQYSLASDGTQTWYYTRMEGEITVSQAIEALSFTHMSQPHIDKIQTYVDNGAYIGDLIIQSPEKGVYHPVADLLWKAQDKYIFAP